MTHAKDFAEIAHSGGKITFHVRTDDKGNIGYQVSYSSNRPVPSVLITVYALPQGIVVESVPPIGMGDTLAPPSIPGSVLVFIASDSEGKFGHHCPRCREYWRSGPLPNICPYCALRALGHKFLSNAQRLYVRHYCMVLGDALDTIENGDVIIDMDEVADAVGRKGDKPSFYVSEESQQHKFTCTACEEFNDILGRFGYCSQCGTRNDLSTFENKTIAAIRERLNSNSTPSDCVRDAVAAFDSFTVQYAKQLAALVPMTKGRRERLLKKRFHDFEEICSMFQNWFDIDIALGMKQEERRFVALMFHRRHVYEHNGGEVDQKYLNDSGDKSVRLKQAIQESLEGAHRLLGTLVKMARNLHQGFHELIPPREEAIKFLQEKKARMEQWRNE